MSRKDRTSDSRWKTKILFYTVIVGGIYLFITAYLMILQKVTDSFRIEMLLMKLQSPISYVFGYWLASLNAGLGRWLFFVFLLPCTVMWTSMAYFILALIFAPDRTRRLYILRTSFLSFLTVLSEVSVLSGIWLAIQIFVLGHWEPKYGMWGSFRFGMVIGAAAAAIQAGVAFVVWLVAGSFSSCRRPLIAAQLGVLCGVINILGVYIVSKLGWGVDILASMFAGIAFLLAIPIWLFGGGQTGIKIQKQKGSSVDT